MIRVEGLGFRACWPGIVCANILGQRWEAFILCCGAWASMPILGSLRTHSQTVVEIQFWAPLVRWVSTIVSD